MLLNYPHITISIYENDEYPVVVHTFYGKTLKEARAYVGAHKKTDEFMRDAIDKKSWRGMKLRVDITESKG